MITLKSFIYSALRRQGAGVFMAALIAIAALSLGCQRSPAFPTLGVDAVNPDDSVESRLVSARVKALKGVADPALAYPIALSLETFEASLSRETLAELYETQHTDAADPLVKAWFGWRRGLLRQRQGDLKGATASTRRQGLLTRWSVLGPLQNEGGEGLTTVFEPEKQLDVSAVIDGRFPDLSWQTYESVGEGGYVSLDEVVAPTTASTLFAATTLDLEAPRDAVLWLGVDGAYRVWLNGALVATMDEDAGAVFDRDGFKVKLEAGENVLLVKVANDEGRAGFYARLTDSSLAPLPLSHGQRPPSAGAVTSNADGVEPVAGPQGRFDQAFLAFEGDGDARAEVLAWRAFLQRRMTLNSGAHVAESQLLEAAELAPDNALVAELSVALLEEAWRQRELLEAALLAHPEAAWLRVLRIQQLVSADLYESTTLIDAQLEALRALNADSVTARAVLIEHEANKQLSNTAWRHALELAANYPDVPLAQEAPLWHADQVRRRDAAVDGLKGLLRLHADDVLFRLELAELQAERAEVGAALETVDAGLVFHPRSVRLMQRRIELLESVGRGEEAESHHQQLLSWRPTDASLWERYGRWLLKNGDSGRALVAFNRAQLFEPQNASLRQLIGYLNPKAGSFEEPFLISDLDALDGVYDTSADYAVRVDQKITFVYPDGLSSTYHQQVYDVLTRDGAKALSYIPLYYTPGEEELEVDMVLVTKEDGTTRSIFERQESSAVADESYRMYYDYHQVALGVQELSKGDRLEVRYRISEVSQSNYFDNHFGDVWFLQSDVPKRYTRYVLIVPEDRALYFREPQSGQTIREEQREGGRVTYIFTTEDVPGYMSEVNMPGVAEVADYLHVTTFADWGAVARWYWNLASEQWVVDREIEKVVRSLTDGVSDRREIVSRIHNYVVKNTRYVALEFGIHGYKPYRTTLCFRRRFGDCKDKASLIKVMLEEAGVPANIVLTRTRRNGRIDTSPASLSIFDHAIAYVPEFDLFLDGTAEFSGTNELPAMDEGVTVLIVEPEGGFTLATTPMSKAEANVLDQRYDFNLEIDSASVAGEASAKGLFAPEYRRSYESEEKRAELLEGVLASEFPGASVKTVDFDQISDLEVPVHYTFSADVSSPLKAVGEGWMLYPIGRKADLVRRLVPLAEREHDLVLQYPLVIRTRYRWALPEGVEVSQLPSGSEIETPFGALTLSIAQVDASTVEVQSQFVLRTQKVARDDYVAFRRFIVDVDSAFAEPILLKKRP